MVEEEFIYSHLFHNHPDGVLIIEEDIIIDCNKAAIKTFGVNNKRQLIGIRPCKLSPLLQRDGQLTKDIRRFDLQEELDNNTVRFNWTHQRASGEEFEAEIILITKEFAEKKIDIAIVKDISELGKMEDKIKFLSYKDNLTRLYNRDYFIKYTTELIANFSKTNNNEQLGILLLDIDDFKSINDNLGHDIGDIFLKEIADRLRNHIGDKGLVAKFGGDEFIILLHNVESESQLTSIGQEVLRIFDEPFNNNGHDFYGTCSVGISMYPQHGLETKLILKNADIALHKAKEYLGNRVIMYSQRLNLVIKERFQVDSHLRYAINNDEMYLNYQPILDTKTQKIIGVEALARWNSPKLGHIPPNKFIPIAEGNGLIVPVGEWILKTACLQLKKWKETGLREFFLSINISIKQLEQKDFGELLENILRELALDPRDLVIEITETSYMVNLQRIFKNLKKINELGVQISIDDFGTGYSSLSQLSKLEISKLKIDKSFIKEVHLNTNKAKIVTAIISMAKSLNLTVVAEGVEEIEHVNFLKHAGCDMLQGFLFSKPVSSQKIKELLSIGI